MESAGPLRRVACERCRSHKLRCERAGSSDTSACKRCLRKGVACTTGWSMRMGRPSRTRQASSTDQNAVLDQVSATTGLSEQESYTQKHQRRRSQASAASSRTGETQPHNSMDLTAVTTAFSEPSQTPTSISTNKQGSFGIELITPQTGRSDATHDSFPFYVPDVPNFGFDSIPSSNAYTQNQMPGLSMASDVLDFHLPFTMAESGSSRMADTPSTMQSTTAASSLPDTVPSEHSLDMNFDLPHSSLKDNILQKLTVLSGDLLQDLKRISAEDTTDSNTPASVLTSAPPGQKHNVGRMLEYSEKFLEILQHIADAPSPGSRSNGVDGAMATVRYFNYGNDDGSMGFDNGATTTLSQLLGDGFSSSQMHKTNSPTSPDTTSPSLESGSIRPDIPTMLAILSCYTCLIRLYGRVFAYIQRVLQSTPSQTARQRLLPPFPGLHLCGFKLEQHQNLQLEILSRVSLHMLGRIEKTLESIGRSCVSSGVMEESFAANLLTMITKQNLDVNMTRGNQHSNDEGSLKEITKTIRELLEVRLAVS